MVIEHMTDRTGPFALVRGEHVAEFKRAGEEACEEITQGRFVDGLNSLAKNSIALGADAH